MLPATTIRLPIDRFFPKPSQNVNTIKTLFMDTLKITDTIGSIAAKDYRKAEVLREKGIDFSYDGNRTLEEVSRKMGMAIEQLETELNQVNAIKINANKDFTEWTLDSLIDYIINVYHIPAKENAVIIYDLAQKASYQRCVYHPELSKLAAALFFFFDDFLMHLRVEEQILFPAIKELNKMKNDTEKNSRPAFSSVLKSMYPSDQLRLVPGRLVV